MPVYRLGDLVPRIAASAFVAPDANVIGNVILAENTSVWFGATLRGDNEPITIGTNSNVQEATVMHTDPGFPLAVGADVTIGHQAMLHGCTIGPGSLIGIKSLIMNGAVIGESTLVGAGAIVTEGKAFPPRTLLLGAPARVARDLTDAEVERLRASAAGYVRRRAQYLAQLMPAATLRA
jgi:carbonic anhydrase/acetyltransferase-like protein (isoleucine patch superfamily)